MHVWWSEATRLSHLSHWVVRSSSLKIVKVALCIRQFLLVYDAVINNPQISVAYSSKSSFFAQGTYLLWSVYGSALYVFILGFRTTEQPQSKTRYFCDRGKRARKMVETYELLRFLLGCVWHLACVLPFHSLKGFISSSPMSMVWKRYSSHRKTGTRKRDG